MIINQLARAVVEINQIQPIHGDKRIRHGYNTKK